MVFLHSRGLCVTCDALEALGADPFSCQEVSIKQHQSEQNAPNTNPAGEVEIKWLHDIMISVSSCKLASNAMQSQRGFKKFTEWP